MTILMQCPTCQHLDVKVRDVEQEFGVDIEEISLTCPVCCVTFTDVGRVILCPTK